MPEKPVNLPSKKTPGGEARDSLAGVMEAPDKQVADGEAPGTPSSSPSKASHLKGTPPKAAPSDKVSPKVAPSKAASPKAASSEIASSEAAPAEVLQSETAAGTCDAETTTSGPDANVSAAKTGTCEPTTTNLDPVAHHFTSSGLPRSLSPIYSASSEDGVQTVSFHRDSDLFIRVKGDDGKPVLYEVVSFSLAAVSNVFRKMVWGPEHSRHESDEAWIIELDDDAKALRVLMRMIHYQFSSRDIPAHPSQDDLYHITKVAHKYELDNLLVPFAAEWNLSHHRYLVSGAKTGAGENSNDKALWICWKLADLRVFKTMVRRVALSATVDAHGVLLQKDNALPRQLHDLITTLRSKAVVTVLKTINKAIKNLMKGDDNDKRRYCHGTEQREECTAMLLGSGIAGLVKNGLWPVPRAETYNGSFAILAKKVLSLGIKPFSIPGKRPHEQQHSACSLGLETIIRQVQDEESELFLPDYVVKYMELRGKVLRTFDECAFAPYRSQAQLAKCVFSDSDVGFPLEEDDGTVMPEMGDVQERS